MARIVVLGGGESGAGSAVLAKVQGFDVFLSDSGTIAPKHREILEKWDIPFEEKGHTNQLILNADTVVKSPGIPDKVELIKLVRSNNIPIVSEIEFTAPYCKAKTICITGSNGKTTTTTLIYEIMRDAGMNVALAGNIGESFALSVATQKHDWYVIELSSFQLDGMYEFRADIAILLNITPDHLDRYEYILQNYIDSKFRITQNQGPAQSFIYCMDDPLTMQNLNKHALPMKLMPFSVKLSNGASASVNGRQMVVKAPSHNLNFDLNNLKIKGIHNQYNAMAATIATLEAGVEFSSITQTLNRFSGVEHRLEPCGVVDGVEYINDSKATNVDSVWYALQSMDSGSDVIWIAGGTDKGNDYSQLFELAQKKVKTLICMGVDNKKLIAAFSGMIPEIIDTHSAEEAFRESANAAKRANKAIVLLSPACASFDLFKNYEHRGKVFKQWVQNEAETTKQHIKTNQHNA